MNEYKWKCGATYAIAICFLAFNVFVFMTGRHLDAFGASITFNLLLLWLLASEHRARIETLHRLLDKITKP